MTLAEEIARYVTRMRFEDLPSGVVAHAKRVILDSLGVAIAGAGTPWSRAAWQVALEEGGSNEATVFVHGQRLGCASAAFVNCIFAHSLDFNDDLAGCQLGALAAPTSFAVGQRARASGKDVILATVLAYDVMTRVAVAADSQELYLRGFQPTALCGPFAAATAAGKLLGLDSETLATAYGIAGSYAGGLIEFLKHGTDTKRLHVGKAAHGGVMAVLLARRGMTGPRTIFEGECGFFQAFCGRFWPEKLLEDLGARYDILDTSVKLYPFCDGNAAPLEAALEIVRSETLRLDDIATIKARIKTFLVQYAVDYHGDRERKFRPRTMLDAQMSLPYCLAVGLLSNGRIPLSAFLRDRYDDPEVLRIADRVNAEGDPELDKIPLRPMTMPSIVTVATKDGRTFTRRVDYQKGDPRNPFSEEDFIEKFRTCAAPTLGQATAQEVIDLVLSLDRLEDLDMLVRRLVAADRPAARAARA